MSLIQDTLDKLKKAGKTDKQARWIMQKQFEQSWVFIKWTQMLTEYWIEREKMTSEERAVDRLAKSQWESYDKYIVWENWKPRVKNQYRSTKIKKFKSYIK